MKTPCIIPGCSRPRYCRGLCKACYHKAAIAVARGDTTWQQLESAGIVMERKVSGRPSPFSVAMRACGLKK